MPSNQIQDNRSYFNYFFTLFTAIYLIMTVIILQVMSWGLYSTVDETLLAHQDNIQQFIGLKMSLGEEKPPPVKSTGGQHKISLSATTDILLFDSDGNLLNQINQEKGLADFELDKNRLDEILPFDTENYWGEQESYRILTREVDSLAYPQVAYATVVTNTNQLQVANSRYVRIVVSVMIFFWILSIFTSMYLAKWTRRPILESFERQKSFVENASHELRTPLAVLQNRLESLFHHPMDTILDQSESIAASLDEVRNMKHLTTNLLNLARRDDGLTPVMEGIDSAFFDSLFTNYQLIAEETGKSFHGDNQLDRIVQSDPVLLKQMITILFDNAIKYTDEDGVIKISVVCKEKFVQISVEDNGPGISDQDKSKIFDRFYRVDKARTRQTGGFGLGLSLAQQIVTSLKGSITVKDNQPKGTIFVVKL